MHVEASGNGVRHFLGLHGWNGTLETFRPLVQALPPDVTFWSADLPGCGQSPRPAALNLDAVLDDALASIDRLPSPMTLVGNCSGAIMALLLMQRRPQRFTRLVMIDAFAWLPWYFRVFLSPIGGYAYWTTFANPVGRALTNLALVNRRGKQTNLTAGFRRTDHQAMTAYLHIFEAAAARIDFGAIAAPVDVLYGERTFGAVRGSIAFWRQKLHVDRVACLLGAGHLPIQEATAQLRDLLFATQKTGEHSCSTPSKSPALAR